MIDRPIVRFILQRKVNLLDGRVWTKERNNAGIKKYQGIGMSQ
jgi:hypothetical protein